MLGLLTSANCKLGMSAVSFCPWGSSAGEVLLAVPFWPSPSAGLQGGQGNAGFENNLQDWALLALPVGKASALQKCLRKLLPFDKGELLPLFA